MKNLILLFIAFAFSLQSCIVNKPYSNELVTINAANKTYMIAQAHYKRKPSALGITIQVGATAAGAAIGAGSQATTFYDANNRPATSQILNGVIGATLGYGISSIINVLQGQGKVRNIDTQKEWIEKYNRKNNTDFIVYGSFANSLNVISASAEQSFRAADLEDAKIFKAAFPNSANTDVIAKQCLESGAFNREEYEILLREVFPNNAYATQIQEKHLRLARTVNECIKTLDLYPGTKLLVEKKSVELIASLADVKTVTAYFPNSNYASQIVENGIKTYTYREELKQLIDLYAANSSAETSVNKARKLYIDKAPDLARFIEACELYPQQAIDFKTRSIAMVRGVDDAQLFVKKFGREETTDLKVFENALNDAKRNEIPTLINLYPSISSTVQYKAKVNYASLSKTIEECKEAAEKYYEVAEVADYRAYQLADDIATYNQYLNRFPTGKFLYEVQIRCRNALGREFSKLKDLDYWDVEIALYQFVSNYQYSYDPDNFMNIAKTELNSLQTEMAASYDRLNSQSDGYRLVVLEFSVPQGKLASAYLKNVASWMQDLKSGLIIKDDLIKGIQNYAAKGNRGIVHATWYRSGTSHGNSWALISTNEGFPAYQKNIKGYLSGKGVSVNSCSYNGDYADDAAKREQYEQYQREQVAKEGRQKERLARAEKGDCESCYTKISHKAHDRGNGGLGCPSNYTYEEYNFTCLNGSTYVIYYVNNTGKWAIRDNDCQGSYDSKCQLVIELCKCEEK
jgi:hypothetical protein